MKTIMILSLASLLLFSCKKKENLVKPEITQCPPDKEMLVTSMEYVDSVMRRKHVLTYQYNLRKLEMIQEKNVYFSREKPPEEEILNTFKIEYPLENKIKIIKNDNDYCDFEINNEGRVDKINYASGDTLYLYYNSLGQRTFTKSNTTKRYLEYSTDNHLLKDSTITLKNNKWEWYRTVYYYDDNYAPNPMYRDRWIYLASGTGYHDAYIPNGYWQTYPNYESDTENPGTDRGFIFHPNGMLKYWTETIGLPGVWYVIFKYDCF